MVQTLGSVMQIYCLDHCLLLSFRCMEQNKEVLWWVSEQDTDHCLFMYEQLLGVIKWQIFNNNKSRKISHLWIDIHQADISSLLKILNSNTTASLSHHITLCVVSALLGMHAKAQRLIIPMLSVHELAGNLNAIASD